LALFTLPQSTSRASLGLSLRIVAVAALVALLYYGRDFFVTLIVSAVLAIILDPCVLFIMRFRLPRPAATGIVMLIALTATYLVTAMIWSQVATLREDLPTYGARLAELLDQTNTQLDAFENKTIELVVPKRLRQQEQQIEQKPKEAMKARRKRAATPAPEPAPPAIQEVRIHSEPRPPLATLYSYFAAYAHTFVMISFVPFLVYFMLSWRDHVTKSFLRMFQAEERSAVGRSWMDVGESTRAYVLGSFLIWLFLSVISAVAFFFLGVPYWPLVGALSAFFSLVPYIGLPLSLLPPVLAALAVPNKFKIVLTILGITAALHFLTMNVAYPKIVGRSVRLNPLVVTVALMFWGLLWGSVGLILAVPITAAIKAVCDNVESLEPYGRMLGD
jgi:predicted PurR-regulated permease PerM